MTLDTPYLVVDVDVLRRNLRSMADHCQRLGLALRPHAKTHKVPEIGRLQRAAGAVGLTVATIGEARVFADAGVDDLFIAYPVWATGSRGTRLRALAEQVRLRVGIDSEAGADQLAREGGALDVLVEVDSGQHRSGVRPQDAGDVAIAAERRGLRVHGVFTFPGHGYAPGNRAAAAVDETRAIAVAEAALLRAGIEPAIRSGGSTPTAEFATATLTELRPGVYAFNDAQQVELGVTTWADVALTAEATVVSQSGDSAILDAGSKILGADRPAWTTGYGRLPDHPAARITALSEHHATADFSADEAVPAVGSVIRVVPNHVCAAVNLVDELVVRSAGTVVDRWRVAARGAF